MDRLVPLHPNRYVPPQSRPDTQLVKPEVPLIAGSILPPLAAHVFCNWMGIYMPTTASKRHPTWAVGGSNSAASCSQSRIVTRRDLDKLRPRDHRVRAARSTTLDPTSTDLCAYALETRLIVIEAERLTASMAWYDAILLLPRCPTPSGAAHPCRVLSTAYSHAQNGGAPLTESPPWRCFHALGERCWSGVAPVCFTRHIYPYRRRCHPPFLLVKIDELNRFHPDTKPSSRQPTCPRVASMDPCHSELDLP